MIYTNFVFAVDACVPNDTVSIILDSSKSAGGYAGNGGYWTFKSKYPANNNSYTIQGIAACLTSNYQYGVNKAVLIDNGVVVVGGETSGQYCFCKLTYPVMTSWHLLDANAYFDGINNDCATGCSGACGWHLQNNKSFRKSLFNSIQN